mmetsp:Transcript_16311/g.38332  ORF Transcript_16311/g.38332 Transcript_16311/m.38332 type:complete len:299 (-) Transcript_16311:611-1507(-)
MEDSSSSLFIMPSLVVGNLVSEPWSCMPELRTPTPPLSSCFPLMTTVFRSCGLPEPARMAVGSGALHTVHRSKACVVRQRRQIAEWPHGKTTPSTLVRKHKMQRCGRPQSVEGSMSWQSLTLSSLSSSSLNWRCNRPQCCFHASSCTDTSPFSNSSCDTPRKTASFSCASVSISNSSLRTFRAKPCTRRSCSLSSSFSLWLSCTASASNFCRVSRSRWANCRSWSCASFRFNSALRAASRSSKDMTLLVRCTTAIWFSFPARFKSSSRWLSSVISIVCLPSSPLIPVSPLRSLSSSNL